MDGVGFFGEVFGRAVGRRSSAVLDGHAREAGARDSVLCEQGGVGEGADAEINEARTGFAAGAVEDEDVRRFDGLVQDADAVRGGERGGGVGDEGDAPA